METETQPSTMPYYKKRRRWLLFRVLRTNTERLPQLHGLVLDNLLWCERCLRIREPEELEFHHPNGNGSSKKQLGGWQAFYAHLEDFESGCELKVLCIECHCDVDPDRKRLGYRTS